VDQVGPQLVGMEANDLIEMHLATKKMNQILNTINNYCEKLLILDY
jgi:hypothetical protein